MFLKFLVCILQMCGNMACCDLAKGTLFTFLQGWGMRKENPAPNKEKLRPNHCWPPQKAPTTSFSLPHTFLGKDLGLLAWTLLEMKTCLIDLSQYFFILISCSTNNICWHTTFLAVFSHHHSTGEEETKKNASNHVDHAPCLQPWSCNFCHLPGIPGMLNWKEHCTPLVVQKIFKSSWMILTGRYWWDPCTKMWLFFFSSSFVIQWAA